MRKFPLHNDTIKGSNATRMPHNVEGGNHNGVNFHACKVHRVDKRHGKGFRKLTVNWIYSIMQHHLTLSTSLFKNLHDICQKMNDFTCISQKRALFFIFHAIFLLRHILTFFLHFNDRFVYYLSFNVQIMLLWLFTAKSCSVSLFNEFCIFSFFNSFLVFSLNLFIL